MKPETILSPLPKWGELRLRKLIAFLRVLPRRKFDFSAIASKFKRNGHLCGTVCCAAGWLPAVFPRRVKWVALNDDEIYISLAGYKEAVYFRAVNESIFGMPPKPAKCLFLPGYQWEVHGSLTPLSSDATPKAVARMLEKYLELTHTAVAKKGAEL